MIIHRVMRPSVKEPASGFRYAYSVYQAEYSRNLIFASGARMDRVSDLGLQALEPLERVTGE
jgi:hypothetical protein